MHTQRDPPLSTALFISLSCAGLDSCSLSFSFNLSFSVSLSPHLSVCPFLSTPLSQIAAEAIEIANSDAAEKGMWIDPLNPDPTRDISKLSTSSPQHEQQDGSETLILAGDGGGGPIDVSSAALEEEHPWG